VNVEDLERFPENSDFDFQVMRETGLIRRSRLGIKLLGRGEISRPVTIKVTKVSNSARAKIEAAGGRVEIV
jgi:large subunit ribosomal protein L15